MGRAGRVKPSFAAHFDAGSGVGTRFCGHADAPSARGMRFCGRILPFRGHADAGG